MAAPASKPYQNNILEPSFSLLSNPHLSFSLIPSNWFKSPIEIFRPKRKLVQIRPNLHHWLSSTPSTQIHNHFPSNISGTSRILHHRLAGNPNFSEIYQIGNTQSPYSPCEESTLGEVQISPRPLEFWIKEFESSRESSFFVIFLCSSLLLLIKTMNKSLKFLISCGFV